MNAGGDGTGRTGLAAGETERRGHLSLRGLRKEYASGLAVRELSLDIRPGEFFTLLGPSGSGKTTTLMMVAGFETPTSGAVLIDGRDVARVPPDLRNVGVVFQNYALFPHMTVHGNLAFPLEVRGQGPAEIERRITEVLELVRLGEHRWKFPAQLSGGQQQRVAIARAVVYGPPILLMDEPLGALDKKLRGHLQLELRSLQRQLGVTVMYVTHDQEEALILSDRIAVMNAGAVEQAGTPRELYDHPATLFVADFLGDSNGFPGRVTASGEGSTTVHLDEGRFVEIQQSSMPPGTRVVAVVRPERIVLGGDGSPGAVAGRIAEVVYVGEATRYWVEVPGMGRVSVKVQSGAASQTTGSDGRILAAGELISLHWQPGDMKLFVVESEGGAGIPPAPPRGEQGSSRS